MLACSESGAGEFEPFIGPLRALKALSGVKGAPHISHSGRDG